MNVVLGIDVGKSECHAALLQNDSIARKSFPNSAKGFEQLTAWLRNKQVKRSHACMEATGGYGELLAIFLADAGHVVSVVNPTRIKAFGQSIMSRTKTDKIDAVLIARFCAALKPEAWVPPSTQIRHLQGLLRRLESLEQMRDQESNRLQAPMNTADVDSSIRESIDNLSKLINVIQSQIDQLFVDDTDLRRKRDLLVSIPAIGNKTAARILAELPDVAQFRDSRAAVAYAGLCPAQHQSGTTSRPSKLSKIGNSRLRRYLYMPAVVAMRYNPALKAMTERLLERGKPRMVIIGALMRKLLALSYAILRSDNPYESALSTAV